MWILANELSSILLLNSKWADLYRFKISWMFEISQTELKRSQDWLNLLCMVLRCCLIKIKDGKGEITNQRMKNLLKIKYRLVILRLLKRKSCFLKQIFSSSVVTPWEGMNRFKRFLLFKSQVKGFHKLNEKTVSSLWFQGWINQRIF